VCSSLYVGIITEMNGGSKFIAMLLDALTPVCPGKTIPQSEPRENLLRFLRFRPSRFGFYEVDLRSGELRKNGLRLKLSGQPFQVLAMLLERPGEMVGREEIQKRLCPADTFVDFDHSLNTAINKIREVLGDSAENPRFVETLPRRGYRFIAPVDVRAVIADPSPGPAKRGTTLSLRAIREGVWGRRCGWSCRVRFSRAPTRGSPTRAGKGGS
jgi:DNA-binding winged helix-turn-helix (wHTH) protein